MRGLPHGGLGAKPLPKNCCDRAKLNAPCAPRANSITARPDLRDASRRSGGVPWLHRDETYGWRAAPGGGTHAITGAHRTVAAHRKVG
jgi:hypothetical protein